MQRSTHRILTTHAGSLPRPADLLEAIAAREQGRPVDEPAQAARMREAVKEVVKKQIELGIKSIAIWMSCCLWKSKTRRACPG